MTRFAAQPLVVVLGPTDTGKTHLAVERMCGHSSGLIGFPLRLLARKGAGNLTAREHRTAPAITPR